MTKIGKTNGDGQQTNDDAADRSDTGLPTPTTHQTGTAGPGTAGPGTAGPGTPGPGTAGPGARLLRSRTVLAPVVERYTAARAATAVLAGARGADAPTDAEHRHELMVRVLVTLLESVGDVPVLLRELHTARMRAADLTAAGRATLAADRDGEADPLFYLRDELSYQAGGPDGLTGGAPGGVGDVAVGP